MRLDRPFEVGFVHRVRFTRDALAPANATLAETFAAPGAGVRADEPTTPRRAIAFIDRGVADATPGIADRLLAYFAAQRPGAPTLPDLRAVESVAGGEATKTSTDTVDQVIAATHRHGIDRRSFVIAIGGGAVLDAVGFGATIAHRGVRLVRLPTTTLSMDDGGMGVKNGINRFGKKNFVGAFAVPSAVICDERFLDTLPLGHYLAGFSEAVKIACLKDAALLARIERDAERIRARDLAAAMPVIERSAELHLTHITDGGDPFELTEARPLDFGHWAAHRIEAMTGFAVAHGDAVGIGIALDCEYAVRAGILAAPVAARVRALLVALGLPTWHACLDDQSHLLEGLEEFREHLGGELNVTLLTGVGSFTEVHSMDPRLVAAAAQSLAPRAVR